MLDPIELVVNPSIMSDQCPKGWETFYAITFPFRLVAWIAFTLTLWVIYTITQAVARD